MTGMEKKKKEEIKPNTSDGNEEMPDSKWAM